LIALLHTLQQLVGIKTPDVVSSLLPHLPRLLQLPGGFCDCQVASATAKQADCTLMLSALFVGLFSNYSYFGESLQSSSGRIQLLTVWQMNAWKCCSCELVVAVVHNVC
jgi:hypothetical protein